MTTPLSTARTPLLPPPPPPPREIDAEELARILNRAGQLLESGYPLNPLVVAALRRLNGSCAKFCRMVNWSPDDFELGRPAPDSQIPVMYDGDLEPA